MIKFKKLESSKVVYFIFLGLVILEIIGAGLSVAFATTVGQRDAGLNNIFLGFLAIVLFSLPWIIETRFKIDIPNYLEIIVSLFIFASIVMGNIHGLVDTVKGYDKFLHIVSGTAISIIGYEIIYSYNLSRTKELRLNPGLLSVFAFCFAITLLVLWEFYEFAVDTIAFNISGEPSRNMQRYQWINESSIYPQSYGLMDTMLDLIIGAFGAFVVSFVGWRILVKKFNYERRKDTDDNWKSIC